MLFHKTTDAFVLKQTQDKNAHIENALQYEQAQTSD